MEASNLKNFFQKPLIFFHGKGGVGKTTISQSMAWALANQQKRCLWVTTETFENYDFLSSNSKIYTLKIEFQEALEEYLHLKLGSMIHRLTKNQLFYSLSQAIPGLKELVTLGKIWFECRHYDHVIVDLPSTGYGLALFQSTLNFTHVFQQGPFYQDARAMLKMFDQSEQTAHCIISLPEELPLQESLELQQHLHQVLPHNPPSFLVNRLFPSSDFTELPKHHSSQPFVTSASDYAVFRQVREQRNLERWSHLTYGQFEYQFPSSHSLLIQHLAQSWITKGYL